MDTTNWISAIVAMILLTFDIHRGRDLLLAGLMVAGQTPWRNLPILIFELTGDYRSPRGFSYAFIMIEADGRKHQVFNIGMEVPAIKAMVEATGAILPVDVKLEYREGHIP